MKASTAIKKIMKQTGWTYKCMAEAVGAKSVSVVGSRLSQKNMSFDTAQEMLDKMGYEIVIKPVSTDKREEGAIVIDGVDEE